VEHGHRFIKSPRPIRSAEGDPPTDIVYGKASNVLRMMEAYEGEDVFRAGINAYLKAHAFGSVTAEDFWNAQARASGKPIDKIMPTFIDQPGVPLIRIETRKDGAVTSVTLTQHRFFRDRAAFAQGSPDLWQVPVCLRSGAPHWPPRRRAMRPAHGADPHLQAQESGAADHCQRRPKRLLPRDVCPRSVE